MQVLKTFSVLCIFLAEAAVFGGSSNLAIFGVEKGRLTKLQGQQATSMTGMATFMNMTTAGNRRATPGAPFDVVAWTTSPTKVQIDDKPQAMASNLMVVTSYLRAMNKTHCSSHIKTNITTNNDDANKNKDVTGKRTMPLKVAAACRSKKLGLVQIVRSKVVGHLRKQCSCH